MLLLINRRDERKDCFFYADCFLNRIDEWLMIMVVSVKPVCYAVGKVKPVGG